MQKKKIMALILSVLLFLNSINTIVIAQNKNLLSNVVALTEKKEDFNNLKDTIIQVNKLASKNEKIKQNFITLDSGIFKIGFDEDNKRLKVFDIKSTILASSVANNTYFSLKLSDSNFKVKNEISFIGSDIPGWGKEDTINYFQYEYGDILTLNAIIPEAFYIYGKILGVDKDYPYIIPSNKNSSYNFKITKEGLEILNPINYKEKLSANIIEIRSEFWVTKLLQ